MGPSSVLARPVPRALDQLAFLPILPPPQKPSLSHDKRFYTSQKPLFTPNKRFYTTDAPKDLKPDFASFAREDVYNFVFEASLDENRPLTPEKMADLVSLYNISSQIRDPDLPKDDIRALLRYQATVTLLARAVFTYDKWYAMILTGTPKPVCVAKDIKTCHGYIRALSLFTDLDLYKKSVLVNDVPDTEAYQVGNLITTEALLNLEELSGLLLNCLDEKAEPMIPLDEQYLSSMYGIYLVEKLLEIAKNPNIEPPRDFVKKLKSFPFGVYTAVDKDGDPVMHSLSSSETGPNERPLQSLVVFASAYEDLVNATMFAKFGTVTFGLSPYFFHFIDMDDIMQWGSWESKRGA